MACNDFVIFSVPASTPRDLTPVAVEGQPTWITLNWQPPRQPNGQITGTFQLGFGQPRELPWLEEIVACLSFQV